ncbi:MAG: hypothetical protein AAGG53_08945, partial [Cyanobacteria bacterium P01_H01_bin.152]
NQLMTAIYQICAVEGRTGRVGALAPPPPAKQAFQPLGIHYPDHPLASGKADFSSSHQTPASMSADPLTTSVTNPENSLLGASRSRRVPLL